MAMLSKKFKQILMHQVERQAGQAALPVQRWPLLIDCWRDATARVQSRAWNYYCVCCSKVITIYGRAPYILLDLLSDEALAE